MLDAAFWHWNELYCSLARLSSSVVLQTGLALMCTLDDLALFPMHRSVHRVYHLDVTCNKILLAVGCNCQSCLMTGGQASQNIWPADISAPSNSLRVTCKFIGVCSLESTEPMEQTDHHWVHCCLQVKPVPYLSQQFWLWPSYFGSRIIHVTHYCA